MNNNTKSFAVISLLLSVVSVVVSGFSAYYTSVNTRTSQEALRISMIANNPMINIKHSDTMHIVTKPCKEDFIPGWFVAMFTTFTDVVISNSGGRPVSIVSAELTRVNGGWSIEVYERDSRVILPAFIDSGDARNWQIRANSKYISDTQIEIVEDYDKMRDNINISKDGFLEWKLNFSNGETKVWREKVSIITPSWDFNQRCQ